MIVTLKELLDQAAAENKAVGSFTCSNMEIVMGTIKAAEDSRTPIIIQIAEGRLAHTPLNMIGPLMVQAAKDAKVPIAVHLDHGLTVAKAKEALSKADLILYLIDVRLASHEKGSARNLWLKG